MATVKVSAPVPDYSGSVGGVNFAAGVATVDTEVHAAELQYFRNAGYSIDEPEPEPAESTDPVDELPKRSASTEVWRTYAVDHGTSQEEADGLTRDQLVELYASKENS